MTVDRSRLAERVQRFVADYRSLLNDLRDAEVLEGGRSEADDALVQGLEVLVMAGVYRPLAMKVLATLDLPHALQAFYFLGVYPRDLDQGRLSDVDALWIMIADFVALHGEEEVRRRLRSMIGPVSDKVDPRLWDAIAEGFDRTSQREDIESWLLDEGR